MRVECPSALACLLDMVGGAWAVEGPPSGGASMSQAVAGPKLLGCAWEGGGHRGRGACKALSRTRCCSSCVKRCGADLPVVLVLPDCGVVWCLC